MPRLKSEFTFVMLVSLGSDINLKLNTGLDRFINGSNLHLHSIMCTFDVRVLTVWIMKSGVNIQQPSGVVIG